MTILVGIIGVALGALAFFLWDRTRTQAAKQSALRILQNAKSDAEAQKKEVLLEAKEEVHQLRKEAESEVKQRRNELQQIERRLIQKEEALENKAGKLDEAREELENSQKHLDHLTGEMEKIKEEEFQSLQRIAGMTTQQAQDILLKKVEEEARHEAGKLIKEIENEARDEGERRARNIIGMAIQRYAADHTTETTVTVVPIPSDDMKGRIIGREGRNIRAIETLTGITVIIDDTPEAVTLSGFDPVRRETARILLEKLMQDGRIHPARIEEMHTKAAAEVDAKIKDAGEQAIFELGLRGVHPEMVRVMGRLLYRTSYGQNVLKHCTEMAHIAGMMAAELGTDVKQAKRAAFLHDVGKAVDHEIEGPHAAIGADLAKRLGESPDICNAIEAHHGEIEPKTIEAVLVQAADAVSASRPGARRELFENYIKRLEKLESIAYGFKGVEKSYAIQAGREIRIMVKPDEIDDSSSVLLARDIARKVEEELEYPGQIRVTVIRESRAVEYAK